MVNCVSAQVAESHCDHQAFRRRGMSTDITSLKLQELLFRREGRICRTDVITC